jgi:hypothetical protein
MERSYFNATSFTTYIIVFRFQFLAESGFFYGFLCKKAVKTIIL